MEGAVPTGMPEACTIGDRTLAALLVPAIKGGKAVPVTVPPRKGVEIPVIEVVFERGAAD